MRSVLVRRVIRICTASELHQYQLDSGSLPIGGLAFSGVSCRLRRRVLIISEREVTRLLEFSRTQSRSDRHSEHRRVKEELRGTELTPNAKDELQRVTNMIHNLPEIRETRVEEIKAQLQDGTYDVCSDAIADLIIRRTLADNTNL